LGLSGSLSAPNIVGAGLLSSVGESQACLGPGVKKLPLTVACVDQSYDITRPQPQLFVADDSKHLAHVLAEYEATMAYRVGGAAGLAEARRARTVVTVILGAARDAQAPPLQGEPVGPGVSGVVKDFTIDGDGKVVAVVFSGKTQVGYEGHQLDGGGVGEQPVDVLVPVGRFRFLVGREPARVTDAELAAAGVAPAKHGKLELASGLAVEGYVERFVHEKGALIAIGWRDAVVKQDGKVLRAATAGERWLMPVGTEVISVYAGSQDEMLFSTFDFGTTTTIPGRQRPFTKEETDRFADYARVRAARETVAGRAGGKLDTAAVEELAAIGARHKDDWLLRLEVVETAMLSALPEAEVWRRALHDDFPDPERQRLVSKGLEVLQ
jgi:phenylalanine-4-hydroxylase